MKLLEQQEKRREKKEKETMPFITFWEETTGIVLGEYQYPYLLKIVNRRRELCGQKNMDEYIAFLRTSSPSALEEWRGLLHQLTVKKTSWFRSKEDFETLTELLLPEILRKKSSLKIWCAGCATGEEVYSILLALLESPHWTDAIDIQLMATDIDQRALQQAKDGVFPLSKLSQIPKNLQKRYFSISSDSFRISEDLSSRIHFSPHNLQNPVYPLPQSGLWNVIFCRNVLIYFRQEKKVEIFDKFSKTLKAGGSLFLGYSEFLFGENPLYSLERIENKLFYRKKNPSSDSTPKKARPEQPIKSSSRRILFPSALPTRLGKVSRKNKPFSSLCKTISPVKNKKTTKAPLSKYGHIISMIQKGLDKEAEEALQNLVSPSEERGAYYLILGNLYFSLHKFYEALESYEKALKEDPFLAMAYLLSALVLQKLDQKEMALSALKKALYLEPNWPLSHFYLAFLYEKKGALQRSIKHFVEAEKLLLRGESPLGTLQIEMDSTLLYPKEMLSIVQRKLRSEKK